MPSPWTERATLAVVVRRVLVGALLAVYALLAATAVRDKSITFDELGHLTGGTAAWLTGDYRLFPQNGQFPQRWATLPVVASGVRFPSRDQPAWWSSDLEAVGHQFLYQSGNDHDRLLWRARLAMIPLGVLLGALCYVWARRLFGVPAGLVALSLFAFSPGLLAHGGLATSDVAAALAFTAALGAFWLVIHRASPPRVGGSALLMGLLCITKMSGLLMVPVALLVAAIRVAWGPPLVWSWPQPIVIRGRRHLARATAGILAAHLVGAVLVIWGSYGFRNATFGAAVPGRDQMFLGETLGTLAEQSAVRPLLLLVRDLHLLPEPYVFGMAHVLNRSGRFVGFLNGRYSVDGWWHFFPYVWLVKTPLAVFGVLALALLRAGRAVRTSRATTSRRLRVRRAWYRLTPLLVFLVVYWLAAVGSSLNLGERHLLPTYPALFILAGGAACRVWRRCLVNTCVVAMLLLMLAFESIRIWPHSLAYFNAIAGGPSSGYRHLVDSSLDWGQDLPALARWIRHERAGPREAAPIYLSYFGAGDPTHHGIEATQIYSYQDWRRDRPLSALTGGIYCISATMLQSLYTRAPGPWSVPYELAYQQRRRQIAAAGNATHHDATLARRELAAWRRLIDEYEQLRLARLAAYLRRREPDDRIGYSILVFRLTDQDVEEALTGPPVELMAHPAIEGADP